MDGKPISFSAPMVRAILSGHKTMTRRVAKFIHEDAPGIYRAEQGGGGVVAMTTDEVGIWAKDYAPHGVDDALWVREAWRTPANFDDRSPSQLVKSCLDAGYSKAWCPIHFEADAAKVNWGDWRQEKEGRLRASMHLPRAFSRIALRVTDIKVERLCGISEDDARAEGIVDGGCLSCGMPEPCGCNDPKPLASDSFARLWNDINGPDAWLKNPWVVAYTFEKVKP